MEPVNLSEIVAKTDIEMYRLTWNSDDLKDYLIKTYSKRSCVLLTEEELLDFLRYLKDQPTPPIEQILIAKINTELERLCWAGKKEKEYLITTYNKQSLTELNRAELRDFFIYLELQVVITSSYDFYSEYEEFQDDYTYPEELGNVVNKPSPEDLAKTDQEIQRLGLSVEWGRDYLIKTYGKRSRVLLTEEELLDFLAFLESQPSHTEEFIEAQVADKLLTDLVAKTDEEIQRLGLNDEWLRNYLMKTYGKRGRYLLTEEELLDFLKYLESLATPLI
ncbi:hypothetical protein IQ244_27680 [Nostoc sp. LEGE 06077]|uniref:hypothetical protein n=1 Tax=Nostoc sp. LEGE 06077 TaxID=915325 RepID=UPI0018830358|nr:hypothetical protein [Nostoc sp. LEGE 06077]MBE9210210.1 hypothetical protein [Nostoc sp. LEGE 06077]